MKSATVAALLVLCRSLVLLCLPAKHDYMFLFFNNTSAVSIFFHNFLFVGPPIVGASWSVLPPGGA